jgi:hypothetical protein
MPLSREWQHSSLAIEKIRVAEKETQDFTRGFYGEEILENPGRVASLRW